jgi:DNA-binding transcriptional LysR family regulator
MKPSQLADLEVFVTIARMRSFRKAAIERGVSASALSQSMRNLESRLGLRLLNRTTRSVAPTVAGEELLSRLGPVFGEVAQAIDHLNVHRQTPAGIVRINAPQPAAEYRLLPLIKAFLDAHPHIDVELVASGAMVDIVKERFDAGVRFGEELDKDMVAIPLGSLQRYVVVASPLYLKQYGVPRHPKDVLGHSCIGMRFPSGTIHSWQFRKAGRPVTIVPKGRLTVSDSHCAIQGAVFGAGLAWVLEDIARDALAQGALREVLADWSPRLPGWYLYYPGRRHVPAALRTFLDFVKRSIREA